MIQQNQQQARQVLVANPQLTKALFQVRLSSFLPSEIKLFDVLLTKHIAKVVFMVYVDSVSCSLSLDKYVLSPDTNREQPLSRDRLC